MKYKYKIIEYFEKEIILETDDPVTGRRKLYDEYADNKHNLNRRKHYGGVHISCIQEVE